MSMIFHCKLKLSQCDFFPFYFYFIYSLEMDFPKLIYIFVLGQDVGGNCDCWAYPPNCHPVGVKELTKWLCCSVAHILKMFVLNLYHPAICTPTFCWHFSENGKKLSFCLENIVFSHFNMFIIIIFIIIIIIMQYFCHISVICNITDFILAISN